MNLKKVRDSKGVDKKSLEELVSLYRKLQNDKTVSKDQAVNQLKELMKKFPNASTDIEVLGDGESWYIEWGSVILGFGESSDLWEVLHEVIGTTKYEMDVAAPDAEDYWDEYRDSIGRADVDITVIYAPGGSSDPTDIVAFVGNVEEFLNEWSPVFVPKDNYFHSSGEMGDITLIGDKNALEVYLKDFEGTDEE